MDDQRQQFIDGLRSLADFMEANAVVPVPYIGSMIHTVRDREAFIPIARALGAGTKEYTNEYFFFGKSFGQEIIYKLVIKREKVCEAKVVGTRIIPAHVIPARREEEIAEHTEEIIEWECKDSILAPQD